MANGATNLGLTGTGPWTVTGSFGTTKFVSPGGGVDKLFQEPPAANLAAACGVTKEDMPAGQAMRGFEAPGISLPSLFRSRSHLKSQNSYQALGERHDEIFQGVAPQAFAKQGWRARIRFNRPVRTRG